MRHDAHYVETLAASAGAPVGRMVPIDQVDPNPDQPRQAMGDLAELIASVTEKGIIEPLVVRQRGPRYQIIAGERRYHAAVQAGLHELPVVIRDVDDGEMLELALVENIQRKDLTPFEESEAHAAAWRRSCGYTHEDLAKRLGKSRTTITEALSLNGIPPEVRKVCRLAGIAQSIAVAAGRPPGRPAEDAGAGREDRQPGRDPRTAPQGSREAESRPAEVVRLRVPAADQGLQPAAAIQQAQRQQGRSDLGARRDPSRAQEEVDGIGSGSQGRDPRIGDFVAFSAVSWSLS